MWQRIKALIIKELLNIWRDPKSRYALIIPPIIQLLILAHAATLEVNNIDVTIYNQDTGWYSHELIQRIKGSPYFANVYEVHNNKQAEDDVNTGKVLLAINIQDDFSKKISSGKSAPVQLVLDGRKSNSAQILQGYINQIITQFNQDILAKQNIIQTTSVMIVPRSWFNPNLIYLFYNIPCLIAILSMITAITVTSFSVARELEMGTLEQLLITPLLTWEILLGKTIPAVLIGVAESTLLMVIALIAFQAPFVGSLLLFWLSLVVFVISIVGIGLFISSISKTQQQAMLGVFIFMVPTMLLSGYATPTENMADWMKPFSWLIPITHFFIIAKGVVSKGMGLWEVLTNIWPIVLVGGFNLLMAGWVFSHKLRTSSSE
jgi:ABC-2 type transport system permease protein